MSDGGTRFQRGCVTIIVPAKNEAPVIGETLRKLPLETLQAAGFETEVVLLDGNSEDGTAEIAAAYADRIISDPEPGKGAAFRNARDRLRGEFVIMLDADGTYAPDAIPRVVGRLARDHADVVMGARRNSRGSMKWMHRLGNVFLSAGASLLYGRVCRDLCTGLWGFRAEGLQALPLRSRGFELEAELFSVAARTGLRVAQVPVDYLPRKGETKLSATRDGPRIAWCLLRNRILPLGSAPQRRPRDRPASPQRVAPDARHRA